MESKPVIFLTFANDRNGRFLEALRPEMTELNHLMTKYREDGGDFHIPGSSQPDLLIRALNSFTNRITIFHYSGHANAGGLHLESMEGEGIFLNGKNLTSILADEAKQNLKLVFLNGCLTEGLVAAFQKMGVPAVIATKAEIPDDQAKAFSVAFYRSLVSGNTLETAFHQGKAVLEPDGKKNRIYRGLDWEGKEKAGSEIPWGLYVGKDDVLGWKLGDTVQLKSVSENRKKGLWKKAALGLVSMAVILFAFFNRNTSFSKETKTNTSIFSSPEAYHILLLPFGPYADCEEQKNQYHKPVQERLQKLIKTESLNIEVKRQDTIFCDIVDPNEVKAYANGLGADMVIYGNYQEYCKDSTLLNVRYILLDTTNLTPDLFKEGSEEFAVDYRESIAEIEKGNLTGTAEDVMYWALSLRAYSSREYGKALDSFYKIQANPEEKAYINLYFFLGLTYQALDRHKDAIGEYIKIIKLDSTRDNFYNNIGASFHSLKQYDSSIIYYSKAIEINPQSWASYNNRGSAYNRLKQFEKAIENIDQAIELNHRYASAYDNRGGILLKLKRYKEALNDFSKAIQIDPKFGAAYNNRGSVYFFQKQYRWAVTDYTTAIKISPRFAQAYNNRGSAFFYQKMYKKAIQDYSEAIKLNPNNPDFYKNRAAAYSKIGESAKAKKDIQIANLMK